jgi:hypothetical protein
VIRNPLSLIHASVYLTALVLAGTVHANGRGSPATVKGVVRGPLGPIPDATVRLQASPVFTTTDSAGSFTMALETGRKCAVLTAWAPGYYIGGGIEHCA